MARDQTGRYGGCIRPCPGDSVAAPGVIALGRNIILLHAITASTGRLTTAALTALLLVGMLPMAALAAPPSGSPTLTTPTEGQVVSSNPAFSWSAVSGATKYRVQVSTSPGSRPSPTTSTPSTSRRPRRPTCRSATLYWRVAATDGGSGIGPFAESAVHEGLGRRTPTIVPGRWRHVQLPERAGPLQLAAPGPARRPTRSRSTTPSDFIGASSFTTEQHELHADRAADRRPDIPSGASAGDARIRRHRQRLVAHRTYTYAWPTIAPAPDAGRRRQFPAHATSRSAGSRSCGAKTYQLQVSPNGDWDNNVTIDVSVKGTKYTPGQPGSQRLVLLARPRQGREEHAQQRGMVDGVDSSPASGSPRPQEIEPAWDSNDPANIPIVNVQTLSWTPVALASLLRGLDRHDVNFSNGSLIQSARRTGRHAVRPLQWRQR